MGHTVNGRVSQERLSESGKRGQCEWGEWHPNLCVGLSLKAAP